MDLFKFFIKTQTKHIPGHGDVTDITLNVPRIFGTAFAVAFSLTTLFSGIYKVDTGYISVEKTWGKISGEGTPGLNFKVPWITTADHIDVKPRPYEFSVRAATTGQNKDGDTEVQMPSTFNLVGTYSVPTTEVKRIVAEYGTIERFESQMLDPRVRQAATGQIPKRSIEDVVASREQLSADILAETVRRLEGLPVTFTALQISNVQWNKKIHDAIQNKQIAKFERDEQAYKLEKQDLQAQETTQTADAKAEANKKLADATAYAIEQKSVAKAAAIEREGEAAAAAIRAKQDALKKGGNMIVKLTEAERWNGMLPQYNMGGGNTPLMMMQMPASK